MRTMTATEAARIRNRAAAAVARKHAEADALEAAGAPEDILDPEWPHITRAQGVAALRANAESLARAASRARSGARIGRA